jgi:hypothetical protein
VRERPVPEVRRALLLTLTLLLVGCEEKYEKGYQDGRIAGMQEARAQCNSRVEEAEQACRRSYSNTPSHDSVVTTVCGGGGVNFNGKHYSGGKTGCVRVYASGKVERY